MTYETFPTTAAEIFGLNENEMLEGYRAGLRNSPEPDRKKSEAFHHGWRNGMVDGKHAPIDRAQQLLAYDYSRINARAYH